MEIDELTQRLMALENAQAESKQQAAMQAFMDKYGSNISNDSNLGLVILNELNRRGVDTSAADEAVQSILDQLRMEATALLDTIKGNMNAAGELIDKIDAMDQSVKAAAPASGIPMPEDMPAEPPMEPPVDMPPEGIPEGAPDEPTMEPEPTPAEPPMEPPAPEAAPEGVSPESAPEQLPPNVALSDERMKNIKNILAHRQKAKVAHSVPKASKPVPKQKMTSFASNIIGAARGGI